MKVDYKVLFSDPAHFIALGFGAGLVPKLPGTAGTVVGFLLYFPLSHLSLTAYLLIVAVISVVGIWAAHRSEKLLGIQDPPMIVIDEIAGILLGFAMLPSGWLWLAVGFLLFRFFDIVKPWPVCLLDRNLHGGIGIMLDDLAAGVYTFLAIQLLVALPMT